MDSALQGDTVNIGTAASVTIRTVLPRMVKYEASLHGRSLAESRDC